MHDVRVVTRVSFVFEQPYVPPQNAPLVLSCEQLASLPRIAGRRSAGEQSRELDERAISVRQRIVPHV